MRGVSISASASVGVSRSFSTFAQEVLATDNERGKC